MSKSTRDVLRDTWFLNNNTKANTFCLLLDDTGCQEMDVYNDRVKAFIVKMIRYKS